MGKFIIIFIHFFIKIKFNIRGVKNISRSDKIFFTPLFLSIKLYLLIEIKTNF
jgi:hypothetical protein